MTVALQCKNRAPCVTVVRWCVERREWVLREVSTSALIRAAVRREPASTTEEMYSWRVYDRSYPECVVAGARPTARMARDAALAGMVRYDSEKSGRAVLLVSCGDDTVDVR